MASYFTEAGNLKGSNADMCSDVAGPSSSGSDNLFQLSDGSNKTYPVLFPPLPALLAAILDLSVTSTPHCLSGRVMSLYVRSIVLIRFYCFPGSSVL